MKPYNEEESKKEQVERMFDNIAPAYDRLNHIMSFNIDRGWRRRMVRMVAHQHPGRIADIATGTGDLAVMLAKKIPSARITGIDLSEEMLKVAAQKVEAKGLSSNISLLQGDAENLTQTDGEFDAVTAAFGVRNFQDLPKGLKEIARILKKGGRVYIMEFSTPRNKIFGAIYRLYSHRILPKIGGLISKDKAAYTYLPQSVDEFPDKLLFLQMLSEAGFIECRGKSLFNGVAYIYSGEKK